MGEIFAVAEKAVIAIMCAVGAAFALWGLYEVATGFSQHNAAKQENGIPKAAGGIAIIAITLKMVPIIFGYLNF